MGDGGAQNRRKRKGHEQKKKKRKGHKQKKKERERSKKKEWVRKGEWEREWEWEREREGAQLFSIFFTFSEEILGISKSVRTYCKSEMKGMWDEMRRKKKEEKEEKGSQAEEERKERKGKIEMAKMVERGKVSEWESEWESRTL